MIKNNFIMEWSNEFPGTENVKIKGVVDHKKEKKLSFLVGKVFKMSKDRKITASNKKFPIELFYWEWTKAEKPKED